MLDALEPILERLTDGKQPDDPLLRGPRGGDRRWGERIAMIASPLTDLLLHGKFRKYRSIKADTVARAIIGLTRERAAGRFVFEHDAILRAARRG